MESFLSLVFLPVSLLNLLGGFVGGVWLAFGGHYSTLLIGFAAGFAGRFGIGLALLPAMAVSLPGAALALYRRQPIIGSVLILLGSVWTYLVVAV